MTGTKTKRNCNQETYWRAELPEELIFLILSKIHDTKTLIRCYSASKHVASFVSTITTISLRVPDRNNGCLSCPRNDHYIPEGAIPGLMKVFANLKSLKIWLCPCCSPPSPAAFWTEVTFSNDNDIQYDWCMTYEIGTLSRTTTDEDAPLSLELNHHVVRLHNGVVEDMEEWVNCTFYKQIFQHRPKTLSSWVTSVASEQGFGSSEKVFMQEEQLERVHLSNSSWLKNPQNVTFWLKNTRNENNWLEEKVWIVEQYDLSKIGIDRHLEMLLDAFNNDDDHEKQ